MLSQLQLQYAILLKKEGLQISFHKFHAIGLEILKILAKRLRNSFLNKDCATR